MKVICMVMVIIAHTLYRSSGDVGMESIRFCCLCFTMPMFFFMSGMVSKIKPFGQTFRKSVRHLLIPCIVFSLIYNILLQYINPGFRPRYDIPGFAMWYLWVLFLYRLSLPLLNRIPYIVPISFVVALCVPMVPWIGNRFGLCRIACFLPYYLLGYKLRDVKWPRLSNLRIILGWGSLCLIFAIWIVFIHVYPGHTYRTAFNSAFNGDPIHGVLLQTALIGTICITGSLVWLLIPDRLLWFTKYGERTLTVYLLHGLIVLPTAYCLFRPFSEESMIGRIEMILIPTLICLILFNEKLNKYISRLF